MSSQRPTSSSHRTSLALQCRFKSKRSSAQYIDPDAADADDVPVMKTKGKGSKNNRGSQSTPRGARSKRGDAEQPDSSEYKTSTRNQDLPDEAFDFDAISSHMSRAVERCRSTTSTLVGSFGRADPALLDSIKVEYSSSSSDSKSLHPLREFATVGVRDGALIVTAFDADMIKHIERAIYTSNLNLTPQSQTGEENVLRVAVPQPTTESRQAMVKDLTRICENARVSIRDARHKAQKQIKSDIDRKVVGKNEGDKESKKIEAETKKWSAQVDQLFEKMKQTLLAA
ncbi:potential mitochondrial ribosome recycling factor [Pseudozyma hubeiensis SY62]|uniref:Potential mitochondrial ribosome recycling factor n=1 Tax=Pseudozyma hubeiensis (strain SY62) TaxID=1305764 RepID=R9PEX3_PSEHS|nr:potential mitochondrial ribosome recycling factor [Pseudozyma hubeiensis SY62]GAC96650.1 potential mitochondrial ribosome recycling factor [Pseudozyma hubeiensis SY62]